MKKLFVLMVLLSPLRSQCLSDADTTQAIVFRNSAETIVSHGIIENLHGKIEHLEKEINAQEHTYAFLLGFIVLLQLCLILLVVTGKSLQKRNEIQMENKTLNDKYNELSSLYSENLKISSNHGMRFFNALLQVYYQGQPDKIVPTMEAIIENLVSDDKVIQQLQETINQTRNNLLIRLESSVPALNEKERLLYAYITAQLDHNAICLILNKTPGAVNAQKHRLRRKIEESKSPWKDEFLNAMS